MAKASRKRQILVLILTIVLQGINAECLFPDYVQSPSDELGKLMPWQTKVWWLNLRNDPKLRELQEIYVQRSQIWSQRQNYRWSCDRKTRRVNHRATSAFFRSCSEKNLLYNRTCLTEDKFNRFRVKQYGPGRHSTFLCIKFVKRSEAVVQIMEGPTKSYNDLDLCDERKLTLEEWPWVAPWRRQVVSCPISGGFSYTTLNKLTNEKFCADEWRRSRLEIDCNKGDGLHFIAPKDSTCNPFSSKSESTRLYCWAGWQEKLFTFLVVGEVSNIPQFCLRFPRDLAQSFTVIVYFSVLCPMHMDGMPPTGIEYHEMEMITLNSDNYTDDSKEQCELLSKRGHCKKDDTFGVHCERSCGKYTRSTMGNANCLFASLMQSSWLFIDLFHKEEVKINSTTIQFSKFGTFICKERSLYNEKLYKTVTVFANGCAPMYTCFEFRKRNSNLLQFRVGESFRSDTSFDTMCQFKDHSGPTIDTYRSLSMKNLILDGQLSDVFCGLSHTIPFNGTVYDQYCTGTISDWDETGCVKRGVINIKSNTCSTLAEHLEYQCLAFINDYPLEQFLITKSIVSGNYSCWVIASLLCQSWDWKFRVMYKLDSPQCVSQADSACASDSMPEAMLYLHDDNKTKDCRSNIFKTEPPNPPYITSIFPTVIHSTKKHVKNHKNTHSFHNIENPSATVYQMDGTYYPGAIKTEKSSSNTKSDSSINHFEVLISLNFILMSRWLQT